MKLGVLFSGGKDSTYAAYLAKQERHTISCLISIWSVNKESYMFHTPLIKLTANQAECMGIPILISTTEGKKEEELKDLKKAIKKAIKKYSIEGVVTGAVGSTYQASRIQTICNDLGIECFNPLWQMDQVALLKKLIEAKFTVRVIHVAAEGLDKSWIGRELNNKMVEDLILLNKKYKINVAFEGGEAESLVVNCPLFSKPLNTEDLSN